MMMVNASRLQRFAISFGLASHACTPPGFVDIGVRS